MSRSRALTYVSPELGRLNATRREARGFCRNESARPGPRFPELFRGLFAILSRARTTRSAITYACQFRDLRPVFLVTSIPSGGGDAGLSSLRDDVSRCPPLETVLRNARRGDVARCTRAENERETRRRLLHLKRVIV